MDSPRREGGHRRPPSTLSLSTPCNGFLQFILSQHMMRIGLVFQLHVMDSRPSCWETGWLNTFQLHVMDSLTMLGGILWVVSTFQLHVMDSEYGDVARG